MSTSMFYVLDEKHEPVLEPDMRKGSEFFGSQKRRVAQHEIGESFVSTVFLCIDHNHSRRGPPVLFETLVEGGPLDGYQNRYTTWNDAVSGHMSTLQGIAEKLGKSVASAAVEVVRWGSPPPPIVRTRYDRLLEDE